MLPVAVETTLNVFMASTIFADSKITERSPEVSTVGMLSAAPTGALHRTRSPCDGLRRHARRRQPPQNYWSRWSS